MSSLVNITYSDRNTTLLKYTGFWFLTGTYNASNVGQTGTLSSTKDLNATVTFVTPVPVAAFYYYGIRRCCGGMYGICIDCDPNNPQYIQIDAVNRTDDGRNPPVVLFSKTFDPPGIHEIIVANQNDTRFNGNSELTIASIVLEEPVNTPTSTSNPATVEITISAGTSASSTSPSSPPSLSSFSSPSAIPSPSLWSSSHTPLAPIIGGVLAALAFVLVIMIITCWIRLRRRRGLGPTSREAAVPYGDSIQAASVGAVRPFNAQSQSSVMTMPGAQTGTPASSTASKLRSPSASTGYGHGATGKHYRSQLGAGQSVSAFSDATGISTSSSGAQSATSNNSNSTRRREVDGGPIFGPVLPEEDEGTLPPDYMDLFSRSNFQEMVGSNSQTR